MECAACIGLCDGSSLGAVSRDYAGRSSSFFSRGRRSLCVCVCVNCEVLGWECIFCLSFWEGCF